MPLSRSRTSFVVRNGSPATRLHKHECGAYLVVGAVGMFRIMMIRFVMFVALLHALTPKIVSSCRAALCPRSPDDDNLSQPSVKAARGSSSKGRGPYSVDCCIGRKVVHICLVLVFNASPAKSSK